MYIIKSAANVHHLLKTAKFLNNFFRKITLKSADYIRLF